MKTSQVVLGLFGGALLLMVIGALNDKSPPSASASSSSLSDADCRKDLHCWGEKNQVGASLFSKDVIERFAAHDAQWTDSWYEMKVSRYGWADKDAGLLRYAGDKVKFQNGFGAWTPMTYRFTYNPDTHAITNVDITEGRLDQN